MIDVVNCPHCNAQLFVSDQGSKPDVLCSSCNTRYKPTFGILTCSGWDIELPRSNREQSRRVYDLRFKVRGQEQALKFSVLAQDSILSLMPNDELLILHTQIGQKLALVENKRVGWTTSLLITKRGYVGQSIIGIGGMLILGFSLGSNFLTGLVPAKYAPFVGMGMTTPIAYVVMKKRRRPAFVETSNQTIAQLTKEQWLYQKQSSLQARLQGLALEKNENLELQRHNSDLINSQVVTHPQLGEYLSTLNRAQVLLQQNGEVLQQLINGYEWKLNWLQMDLGASHLAEALPENQLISITTELEQLESQRQDINALLNTFHSEHS